MLTTWLLVALLSNARAHAFNVSAGGGVHADASARAGVDADVSGRAGADATPGSAPVDAGRIDAGSVIGVARAIPLGSASPLPTVRVILRPPSRAPRAPEQAGRWEDLLPDRALPRVARPTWTYARPPWKYHPAGPRTYRPKTDWTYHPPQRRAYVVKQSWRYHPKRTWQYHPAIR